MPPKAGTRKRTPGSIARSVNLGLTLHDSHRLDACEASLEAELKHPVTRSRIYSVALSLLHHRLLIDQRERPTLLTLLRF
jgi:hypothetical protein